MSDAAYPVELERDVAVAGGVQFRVRPIRPGDAERLVALHGRLSEQTIYQRFFTVMRRLPTNWARYLADVDYQRRLALVVERPGPEGPELVGVGRYEPTALPGRVEVAFVIEDRWQHMGLGTALFNDLLAAAEARGIHEFSAEVLAENTHMLDLIRRFGVILSSRLDHAVVSLVFRRGPATNPTMPAPPPRGQAWGACAADATLAVAAAPVRPSPGSRSAQGRHRGDHT
jgi:RimJ/RimL family protein N-acetyltransferase